MSLAGNLVMLILDPMHEIEGQHVDVEGLRSRVVELLNFLNEVVESLKCLCGVVERQPRLHIWRRKVDELYYHFLDLEIL